MFILYSFFYSLYVACLLPFFLFKSEKRHSVAERFAFIKKSKIELLKDSNPVWVHAVSVGEARLALQLIGQLKVEIPDIDIILTVSTPSAHQIAQSANIESMIVLYSPLDFVWVIKKFIRLIRPKHLVIMETELWPNLLMQVKKEGIGSMVVNGRISNKAWSKYSRIKPLMKIILKSLDLCLAQSEKDAQRFITLGLDKSKVKVIGNIKYDVIKSGINASIAQTVSKFTATLSSNKSARLVLCASTHHDEEEQIVRAWLERLVELGEVKLILAPRHIHRCGDISSMLHKQDIKFVLYSQINQQINPNVIADAQILLLDEWGLLNQIYAFADIIYVGGSLVAWGGHNLAEAAIWKKPLLHGPHMHNFEDMQEIFLRNEASCKVVHSSAFISEVIKLLSNPQRSETLAKNALETVANNSGAVSSAVEEIKKCLSN